MSSRNNRSRKRARRARNQCKEGKFSSQKAAELFLLKLSQESPLRTLGMRAYQCESCKLYHIGRAPSR